MPNNTTQTLLRVSESILEKVAFVFTNGTGPQCRPPSPEWDALGAELHFSGAGKGTIRLWMSIDLAMNIASNMLAVDNADLEKANDAVKELCNIISGNFITEAYKNADIVLHIPSSLEKSELYKDYNDPQSIWFSSDDGPLLAIVKEL